MCLGFFLAVTMVGCISTLRKTDDSECKNRIGTRPKAIRVPHPNEIRPRAKFGSGPVPNEICIYRL